MLREFSENSHQEYRSVLQFTNCPNSLQPVDSENMFMKESSPSKSNIEGGECGSAGFINDICGHENKTKNADVFSFVDVNGTHEAINSSGITQECHDKKKNNFDILSLPTNIQQNEHFELTHLDKIQEMEEFKDRDFKWCDSLFDSYPNKIFENVLDDPELFLQDHVNKNWGNETCPTDSSELISNIVLDNFESQGSTHNVLSGCELKWNEESDIENSFQHQMNEEDNYVSAAFTLNGSPVEQMYGDVINCSKEYFELQPNIIREDNALSDSRVTEVNSKLSDQRSSVSECWPSTQSEILDSIPEVQTIENKKRKKQVKTGCDKRRKVIRRPKLKNCDDTLDIYEHSQDANSNKQLSTPSDNNLEKHCSTNLNDNYGILSRQEKIQSGVVLDGIMLPEDSQQKKLETKRGRNINKRPRTKNKSKLEDNYDAEKNKLCNRELDSKHNDQSDSNNNTLTSPENTYLKNSSIFLEDTTNSVTTDLTPDKVHAMNCDTDNAKCLVENNSPLRMKINLVKKEVVYCGYKSRKTNLRRIPIRSFRKRKNKINEGTQLIGHTERNEEFLVPLAQGEGTKQQLALASVHKRKYCKKNNNTTKLLQTNSLKGSMDSSYCNGYPLVPKKRTKSVSLNCTNYDSNLSAPSDNINPSEKMCDIVDQSDLSYVLTSESVLEDCVLTYKDVLNLRTPERRVSNQDNNEIECCEQLAICKENNSKHSAISETFQFSECDPSFEELDTEVNLENSSIVEEEISGFNWSDINSSALLVEARAFEVAVEDLQCTATAIKDVQHVMESKDLVIKSLQDKIHRYESNKLYKILEHVISEVEQSSIDEMSSASAIVRILWSYGEEKKL